MRGMVPVGHCCEFLGRHRLRGHVRLLRAVHGVPRRARPRLSPSAATGIGDHRHDDRWPDVSEAGRAARLAFIGPLDRAFAALDPSDPDSRRRHRPRPRAQELDGRRASQQTDLQEDRWNPLAWVYLLGDGILQPDLARVRPALRPARQRRRTARGDARRSSTGPARRSSGPTMGGRSGASRPRRRSRSCPGSPSSSTTPWPRPTRRDPSDGARSRPPAAPRSQPPSAPRPPCAPSRRTCAMWSCRASEGEARLGPDLFARKMRHTMRSGDADARAHPGRAAEREFVAVRAEMVRLARGLARPGGRASPCRTTTTHWSVACSTRSALTSTRRRMPSSTSAAPRTSRIEAFCRERT